MRYEYTIYHETYTEPHTHTRAIPNEENLSLNLMKSNRHKVRTVKSRFIRHVNNNGQIRKVGRISRIRGHVVVRVFDLKRIILHTDSRRMLATQVTHLARLRLLDVAWRVLVTVFRVEVSAGGIAVSVFRNWILMDMVR